MPPLQQKTAHTLPAPNSAARTWQGAQRLYLYAGTLLFCEYFLFGGWLWGHYILKNPTIPAIRSPI